MCDAGLDPGPEGFFVFAFFFFFQYYFPVKHIRETMAKFG